MKRVRGSVFVYTLAVMVALIGVLAAVASTERLDVKASSNRKEIVKARMACMGALTRVARSSTPRCKPINAAR